MSVLAITIIQSRAQLKKLRFLYSPNNTFFLCEYADSCSEHFENPAQIINGSYVTPTKPGYSVKIKDNSLNKFDYNTGVYWN